LHELCRELLPEPILAKVRPAKTVIFVPHHILHYFPFAALVTATDPNASSTAMARPQFLIDEPFDLGYAPSLAAWDLLREQVDRPIRQVNASAIVRFPNAPPLPGVEQDIANLRAVFAGQIDTLLTSDEAVEQRARALFDRRGLLFLATHGQNLADDPLASYLMFRSEGNDDGLLTAREIYQADVAADLVVLSACYSGLSDRSPLPGDDLFGIQRALVHSGARTVVAGLWDVYDGTGPILMGEFFRQLAAGQPAPAALARSQRVLLARLRASTDVEPWLHPYFWAVYTTIGDDRTGFRSPTE
jgi:CHAT domain-containing protein